MNTIIKRTKVRYSILLFLFLATVFNYADRATLSVVAPFMSQELGFDPEAMGLAFSAFGIAYAIMQLPGGWLLDRYGARMVYGCALIGWSLVTMLQGTIYLYASPLIVLVILRLLMGAIEAPAFPANSRLSVQWFPNKERGLVTSIYQSAQYISLGIITPLMTIILHNLSWHYIFYYIGAIGVILGIVWLFKVRDPLQHPKVNQEEIEYIRDGGGEPTLGSKKAQEKITLAQFKSVCINRMMIGVYIGQFCVTSITWFFLTWFPTYLYQAKGMSILKVGFIASIPAIAGFVGGLLGGVFSDALLKRGYSLTVARKLPVICGMLLSCVIVIANYTSSEIVVVAAMSVAFFAKGFGNLGWCVLSDTSPKEVLGIAGGVFNMCGNMASIVTPLVIGIILANTQSFDYAILYVGSMGLLGLISYLFIVGPLERITLTSTKPE
ncbi:MFS transporter [Pantoea ananatis]|uniref:MFS transporter n=1 Tax=Pantoea ananas TaxID=553 RepID=UPI0021E84693|nr:MFS transporter [Pantoea ananatis]MCW0305724.1 putative glucarate transporter [Pantoea ananatis]MCW0337429.1 putative glucarate transporter [Pantoea ananatis]MCW0356776.1 putative glucarate transporter [Pantoea ananatis]MCW0361399.1 putative glucarate transporter [Pantoea ananatis]MCW1773841.1 MFS transporter [Pantoea ananatis]